MKREAIVSFVLVVLFLVSVFSLSAFYGAADSHGSPGLLGSQSTVDPTDWWPMFHHDLTHTGYYTSIAPNTNQTLWNYTTGNNVRSSPAVAGGVVYVGSADNRVYALNAATGAFIWSYTTGDWVLSSPAVAGGVVYVGSYDGKVYALNAATGAFIWSYRTGSYVLPSPAVAGGVVYVGSADSKVYALNAATGAQVWNYTTGSSVFSSPAVAGGVVYVGSADNRVYALNAATGAFIWSYATGGLGSSSSPAVACTTKVFVGSTDGDVYCLDASTGALIWKYATGGAVHSSPAVGDGTVFVGSDDHKVYAFGPASYSVTIGAWCFIERTDPIVWVWMDGGPRGAFTPYTFTGLAGTHTFTVPDMDDLGHLFMQWNTGATTLDITVSPSCSPQNYTAYYTWGQCVGGVVIPVDKLGLLAPYVGLASTIAIAAVVTAISVKRVKRRKEKQ
jgi:outer membrane protein assembly factor BamB